MANFKDDIKEAYTDSMKRGGEALTSDQEKAVDKMSQGLAAAIARWVVNQDFQIMKMKAILEVEELKTATELQANIAKQVKVRPGIPTAGSATAQTTTKPGELTIQRKGVVIPALKLNYRGAQGGVMRATGHAYIGLNPVGNETNEKETLVKLDRKNLKGLGFSKSKVR